MKKKIRATALFFFFVTLLVKEEKGVMDMANIIISKYNLYMNIFITLISYFLGKHWYLFAAFLLLNVVDWITGMMKSRLAHKENSVKGLNGIIKKLGYWIMVGLGFFMSSVFIELGEVIGVNLQVTLLLGWFVLASLIVNELRSIFENLVEAGYELPAVLTKGLEVAEKALDDEDKDGEGPDGTLYIDTTDENVDNYHLNFDTPLDKLPDQDYVVLKVNKSHK